MRNNLKFYRQQKESLTQAKLAGMVGISETHYQQLEYGLVKPNIYTARRLADELGVDVNILFPYEWEIDLLK